jgi:CRISPR-associated protein Cmr1
MHETPPANPAPNNQAEAVQPPSIDRLRTAADAAYAAQWHTITLNLKTVTPTLGGGVKPGQTDVRLPFRPRNVRNAIKHWWWLLNRHHPDYQVAGGAKKLYKDMADIWGAAADGVGGGQSRVRVDVIHTQAELEKLNNNNLLLKALRKVNKNRRVSWTHPEIYNNLKYVLWVMQNEKNTILREGYCWTLKIQYKNIGLEDSVKTSIYQAINAWLHLGGIGARTTRGMGKSELTNVCLDKKIDCFFVPTNCGITDSFTTLELNTPRDNSLDALSLITKKYSDFRQARQKRNGGARMVRSFWPKADVIRHVTNRKGHTLHTKINNSCLPVPEIIFGAPIGYKFISAGEPRESQITFYGTDRYTSPLILTSVRLAENSYAAFALYHSNHLSEVKNKSVEVAANTTALTPSKWMPNLINPTSNAVDKELWLADYVRHNATGNDQRHAALVASSVGSNGDPLKAFFNFAENGRYND